MAIFKALEEGFNLHRIQKYFAYFYLDLNEEFKLSGVSINTV
jgi:hypothetical protein